MNITVGTGYVRLSNAILLQVNNADVALDIIEEKVNQINERISPIGYTKIENYFATNVLNITDTMDKELAYKDADFLVIATPTDYNTKGIKEKYGVDNIIFSPEFLRDGKALYDNLYPSRIILGEKSVKGTEFANLLAEGA